MHKPLKVLILEDDVADAELILIALRQAGYELSSHIVDSEKDFIAHLNPDLDLILSDYNLPQFTGLKALHLRNESSYDIPFIIISGMIGEELAINCMHQGADDYLMKDRIERLGTAVENAIKNKLLRFEKKQIVENLRQSEEQYRSVVEDSPGLICRFLPDGTITFANQEYCKFFGKVIDEIIGENVLFTLLKKSRESAWSEITSLTKESPIQVVETENINFTGDVRYLRWTNRALFNQEGLLSNYQSFGEDITEHNRSQQLLNALNQASVAMGTALSQQDIFNTVAKELNQLDISCMLFPVDETRTKLVTKYISYEPAILKPLEKFLGITNTINSFLIDAVDSYRRVIREKETFFEDASKQTVKQMFPTLSEQTITAMHRISQGRKSISAPLIIENKVIGMLLLQSNHLTREDIPAATAFAHELAGAWNKAQLVQDLRKTVEGTIHTIAATVEARDPYTAGHQARVADLASAIASEMSLSANQIEGIKMAGIVHDLGKIQVPAEILNRPGKISELEFEIIKTHPQVGFDLLKEIEFPWPIAQIIYQHHEKMDGSGYPQGLKGDEILLEARILTVADIVEAMASHRPYRSALGIDLALAQIKMDSGRLLDPNVVKACLEIFSNGYSLPGS